MTEFQIDDDLERAALISARIFRELERINVIDHRIVPSTTETDAERAFRYGLERTQILDRFYGYVTFQDDSMMTNIGVYSKRQDAYRHGDALLALRKRRWNGIVD